MKFKFDYTFAMTIFTSTFPVLENTQYFIFQIILEMYIVMVS